MLLNQTIHLYSIIRNWIATNSDLLTAVATIAIAFFTVTLWWATSKMMKEMEKLDIPPVREYIEMIHDAGGVLYACKATVDMFHLTKADFCPQVDDIISVGQFYEKSAGAHIIFT